MDEIKDCTWQKLNPPPIPDRQSPANYSNQYCQLGKVEIFVKSQFQKILKLLFKLLKKMFLFCKNITYLNMS